MIGKWTISDNHIALICDNQLFHPGAEEIYAVLEDERASFVSDISCKNIKEAFANVHFSKIGSPIKDKFRKMTRLEQVDMDGELVLRDVGK